MLRNRFFEPDEEPEIYQLLSWDLCGIRAIAKHGIIPVPSRTPIFPELSRAKKLPGTKKR